MRNDKDKKYLYTEFAMIAFVLLCLSSIASKSEIWFDESFTINLVRKPLTELIRLTGLDVHPPLYYLAVKLCVSLFGESSFSLYLPSILCYAALLLVTAVFFYHYFSAETSLFVTAAFCALPNMLRYAVQLRMYSMAMLFVTVSFYLVYILLHRLTSGFTGKWYGILAALAVSNVLAAYTHYFAGVAAVGISFFLLAGLLFRRENRKKSFLIWCGYCVFMLLLYLPWLPKLFGQMSAIHGNYWIAPLTEGSLHTYPEILFAMPETPSGAWYRELLIALWLTGFFLFTARFTKTLKKGWLLGCYLVTIFWFALGIGYSVLGTPILCDRYLVVLLPLLWLPVLCSHAETFLGQSPVLAKPSGLIPILTFLLFSLCFVQNYEDLYEQYASSYQNELKEYVNTNASEDDIFFHFYIQDLSVCEAWFPHHEQYILNGSDAGQAFHYWPDLTGCQIVDSTEELKDFSDNIWCMNGSFLTQFEEMGFSIETVPLGDRELYRIYR